MMGCLFPSDTDDLLHELLIWGEFEEKKKKKKKKLREYTPLLWGVEGREVLPLTGHWGTTNPSDFLMREGG